MRTVEEMMEARVHMPQLMKAVADVGYVYIQLQISQHHF